MTSGKHLASFPQHPVIFRLAVKTFRIPEIISGKTSYKNYVIQG